MTRRNKVERLFVHRQTNKEDNGSNRGLVHNTLHEGKNTKPREEQVDESIGQTVSDKSATLLVCRVSLFNPEKDRLCQMHCNNRTAQLEHNDE